MIKRWLTIVAVAAFSHALVGCGNPAGLFPVSGKVLHHGEPAAGAVVYFHREGPSPALASTIPFGIVEEDGSFYLTSDGQGDGCPPGKYAVLVEWKGKSEAQVAQPKPARAKGKSKAAPQGQRISISLNSQYFGEELVVETAPNHLAS